MSAAIERRDETIARLRGQVRSIREAADEKAEDLMELAIEGGTAYLFGSLSRDAETNARPLFTVAGLDPEVVWGGGLMIAGQLVGGAAGRLVTAGGRGIVVSYAYERGRRA